jgi:hypothetical protein
MSHFQLGKYLVLNYFVFLYVKESWPVLNHIMVKVKIQA